MGTERGVAALDELSDGEVARLAGAGEERAFEEIFERHGQGLFQLCYSLEPGDAEALFAATVKRAVAELRGGARPDPLQGWLLWLANEEAGDGRGDVAPAGEEAEKHPLLARFLHLSRT